MDSEIKKRQLILQQRRPFPDGILSYIRELNELDWVYSSLRLDGFALERETVRRILKGELVREIPLGVHSLIGNYGEALKLIDRLMDDRYDLSERYLLELHGILIQPAETAYRQSNPVLRHLNYNPPHFKELGSEMGGFFRSYYSAAAALDPVQRAALLHNRLIAVYPFAEQMEATARAAVQFILMQHGYPPIEWAISEQEYLAALRCFLLQGDGQAVADIISQALLLKLGVLLQLT